MFEADLVIYPSIVDERINFPKSFQGSGHSLARALRIGEFQCDMFRLISPPEQFTFEFLS